MTSHPEKILVRGVNWLGDAVMTTPALQRLREAWPQAHITLLTHAKLADLWHLHPAVDAVLTFNPGESIAAVAKRLRRENYDVALGLPNSLRSALEIRLAGIPQRVGYGGQWRRWLLTNPISERPGAVAMRKRSVAEIKRLVAGGGADPALKHRPSTLNRSAAHHLHQYLHLAAALGANAEPVAPELFVAAEEVEAARCKYQLSENAQPIFGLNPGAEYGPAKRWPRDRFVAAAVELQKRTNCRWLIFGGTADVECADSISKEMAQHAPRHYPAINLAGQTSLRELMALLKLCRVLLTNDSGPMHVAAALGTPVVVPFGSTSRELTGPGLPGDARHHLLTAQARCSPCFLRECPIDFRCMTGISVERVVEAVLQVALGDAPATQPP